MGRSLRIALLSYRSKPHSGGQGIYVRALSRELAELGHRIEVLSGPPYPALDEGVPTATLAITGVSSGGGPITPAQECETFTKNQTVHGTYSSFDQHFGTLTLTVEPSGPANTPGPTSVSPSVRAYPAVPTSGESGTWELDTSKMKPCGYIVRLWVQDRTIVSSDGSGWKNAASVGFCLKA